MSRGNELGVEDDGGLWNMNSRSAASSWMDAVVDGTPVTPRHGAPVEIAAMWVFLRRYLADLPEAEVAGVLGCTVGTVKQHASRGLAALLLRLTAEM